jgi:hypothetical protein
MDTARAGRSLRGLARRVTNSNTTTYDEYEPQYDDDNDGVGDDGNAAGGYDMQTTSYIHTRSNSVAFLVISDWGKGGEDKYTMSVAHDDDGSSNQAATEVSMNATYADTYSDTEQTGASSSTSAANATSAMNATAIAYDASSGTVANVTTNATYTAEASRLLQGEEGDGGGPDGEGHDHDHGEGPEHGDRPRGDDTFQVKKDVIL